MTANPATTAALSDEEAMEVPADLEKAPENGNSRAKEVAMAATIVLTQFVQMIPYGAGINSAIDIGKQLGASPVESGWFAASYPLTQGAVVVMSGRLGAILGHKNVAMGAALWWVIFTFASGYTDDFVALCIMRGLSGIGGGMLVPNTLALLTINFPPGKMRNITVACFGAMAPIGAAGGSVFPGFFVQLLPWKWLFFFLAMLGAVVFILFAIIVPSEGTPFDKGGHFDYVGAYLLVGALILFNFVWNQAPAVGWVKPYEYSLLIVSILHLALFLLWTRKFATAPIIPFDIWNAPSFMAVLIAHFFVFMSVGIIIWYVTVWNLEIREFSLFVNAASYAPLACCGALAAIASGKAIRHLAAQYILAIGGIASTVACILIATQPKHQIYWAQTFPALTIVAMGPDFVFTAAQLIASNAVRRKDQGVAASLIATLASYGLSTGLGFAATVERYTNDNGRNPVQGYRNACWLGVGLGAVAALTAIGFVRVPKDVKDGWDEADMPEQERK